MNTYLKSSITTCLLFLSTSFAHAQVGIGTNTPAASAKLEISSTTQGFLPPRMTLAQRQSIVSPVQGLVVYCTDCINTNIQLPNGQLQVYNGISWTSIDGLPSILKIGSQVWMTDNLAVTKYNDGTSIPEVRDDSTWGTLTTGAWCWYNNDPSNGTIYGKLYNWYAVVDPRGLCPAGWHIPTDAEWTALENTLGGNQIAGKKMKLISSLWPSEQNITATNESGFGGLPGGTRLYDGSSSHGGNIGYWWSASERGIANAFFRSLLYYSDYLNKDYYDKKLGMSVRCLKD